ncbi:NAD(P)H-hydrate dehydratase [bacterium]|nr:NAD(P)H-hydrate dehydratase [bacterium]
MIPVANIKQMRECDRYTIEELSLPGLVLMENASRAAAAEAIQMLDGDVLGSLVLIYCGKGNNGGDGFAIARHLSNNGADVEVVLIGETKDLKGDAKTNCGLFLKLDGIVHEVVKEDDFPLTEEIPDLVIDALLGTGFEGRVRGLYAEAIEHIKTFYAPILSVDVPSGVNAESGLAVEPVVSADVTVTFGLIKLGLLLSPGRQYCGDVKVADIGIPPDVVDKQDIQQFLISEDDVKFHLPRLHPAAHKGDAGHVFIIAGSPGMTGAAALSAEAAMRSGAGLTVVGVPESLNPILEAKLTEAMTLRLPENDNGFLTKDALSICKERIEWADVVVFGPGVGCDKDTVSFFEGMLEKLDKPLVIDADGLNLLADNPELFSKLPKNTVLTPHPGEFSRLTGLSTTKIEAGRIEIVRKMAKKWNVALILKGAPSVTAIPSGDVIINTTGNAGMATGGSGDVLTGIIASLIAQGLDVKAAAWMGNYIHGAAGDLAAEELGQQGMVASDIIKFLPKTLKTLS